MEDVEKSMAEIFNNLEFTHEFRSYIVNEAKDIIEEIRGTETEEEKLINQRISKIKLRMENIENERLDHVITREDFARVYERLKQDIEDAYTQLGNLTKDHSETVKILDDVLAFTEDIYQAYTNANPDNKRQILQMFISKVTINHSGIKQIQFSEITNRLIDINQVRLRSDNRDGRGSNPQPFA